MNRLQVVTLAARMVLGVLVLIASASSKTQAQSTSVPPSASAQGAQPQAGVAPQPGIPPATPGGDLAQMRTDLDRMDSLLGNMSSEIEFLRDQNLQILLRTNAQMWTILIRDLRRQIDRDERAQAQSH